MDTLRTVCTLVWSLNIEHCNWMRKVTGSIRIKQYDVVCWFYVVVHAEWMLQSWPHNDQTAIITKGTFCIDFDFNMCVLTFNWDKASFFPPFSCWLPSIFSTFLHTQHSYTCVHTHTSTPLFFSFFIYNYSTVIKAIWFTYCTHTDSFNKFHRYQSESKIQKLSVLYL